MYVKQVEISAEQVEPPSWLPDLSSLTALTLSMIEREDADLRVLFCSSERIAELNSVYRDRNNPTDVLSFADDEQDGVSGDIAICTEEVEANAAEFGVSREQELTRVFVHAVLHLAGFSHSDAHLGDPGSENELMFAIQERIIAQYWKEKRL